MYLLQLRNFNQFPQNLIGKTEPTKLKDLFNVFIAVKKL